ncbi:protein mono-ADP-ribosyltransferase PARP11-like isoform X2 [Dreissena polymorpha]|uniref:protein mono-ADP-ribosyltransferase PARP11-like isoform X2 n=1 Tax=Dreissena polymorpha TaxID=45954 RepID=UPI0022649493|nr:protein mono-ADP-ribosyltransferase PARP11-like isoform X2 [Dreissena polymorpha]
MTDTDLGTSHEGIGCDVCGVCPTRGYLWKCRDCLAYDMCSTCYENNRYMHDMSHSFIKMIHQTKVLAHVEGSRASSFQALPTKRDRSTNNDSGTSHEGIGCDVCGVCPIRGTRWMCRDCLAYDMCSTCYENKRYMHDMSHSFIKMIHQTKVLKEQKEKLEVPETPSFLPSDWTKMKPDEHLKKVNLASSSEEYMTVLGKFTETLDKDIISIRRVQNKFLWEVYFLKRKQMEGMNGKIGANEKNLFHGTKPDIIQSVCAHNLDMRLAGTNVGAILGNGTYFALKAKMSDSYATPDHETGHRFMLQCRVLVGHCTKGKKDLRRPPEVAHKSEGQIRLYDSCVDDVRNPSIFCIFDHVQYYPEYIIEYK